MTRKLPWPSCTWLCDYVTNESAHWVICRLLEGKSGIKEINRFDASEFPTRFGGQIENFDIEG